MMRSKIFRVVTACFLLGCFGHSSAANLRGEVGAIGDSTRNTTEYPNATATSPTAAPTNSPTTAPTTSFQGYLVEKLETLVKQNEDLRSRIDAIGSDVRELRLGARGCITGRSDEVRKACNGNCCTGSNACTDWGDSVHTVCPGSCQGDRACQGFTASTVVGAKACNGYSACYSLGYEGSEDITIESGACVGTQACRYLGHSSTPSGDGGRNILVEEGACRGLFACGTNRHSSVAPGSSAVDGLQIGKGSCLGDRACYEMANGISQIVIGKDSCLGFSACDSFAQYAQFESESSMAYIGDASCRGNRSCHHAYSGGSYTVGSFLIEDRSCQGDGACAFLAT